ncbi:hypothetical protein CRUP_014187 [Coryphaenoides rupestris]|nr:hypothetical protein CRUP_014187 [Coryphaenoides rupestris]
MERPPESFYHHIPREEVTTEKPPRYTSKFRTTVVQENKSGKSAMKTMGPANVEIPSPEKFLQKQSRDHKLTEKKVFTRAGEHSCTQRKPDVPSKSDRPVMGLHSKKDFVKTNDYGETPEYLQQLMEEQQRAQEEYNRYVSDRMREGAMKQLSGEEHAAILEGLNQNWEGVNRQYLGLSLVTDTITKRQRKECLEQALLQLEKDIALMKRYQTIYIAHD